MSRVGPWGDLSAIPAPLLPLLKEPGSNNSADITLDGTGFHGTKTGASYPHIDGIPSLYQPMEDEGEDVTARVRSFYEENPFPSYEGLEEFGELVNKGGRNPFSAELLRAIGYNKKVLECGCGTGQLSQFLQLNNNHVLGIDMSLGSLALAIEHKQRNRLQRCGFVQMNIFDMAIKDNSFDVVISHGVLHHTFDARRAFGQIVRKAKPGGIVMVGLYNKPARVMTWIRSKLVGTFGNKIDYVVRTRIADERKADIWIKDQYYNPHETWHSVGEVLDWFDENDLDYLNTSPGILDTDGEDAPNLFTETDPGTAYKRTVTQLSWIFSIAREGALFDVIGRKRKAT
jgi:ubiquinone/menaquinone biosynthesis C-methylase UbiE